MRYKFLPLLSVAVFISTTIFAQNTTVDKANYEIYKAQNAVNGVNNAVSTATQTAEGVGRTVGTFSDMLGRKKKKAADSTKAVAPAVPAAPAAAVVATSPNPPANQVISITVANVDYAKLKTLEDNIKTVAGVKSTSKTFNKDLSNIEIGYEGSSDKLWDLLPQAVKDMFELTDLNEKKISLISKK